MPDPTLPYEAVVVDMEGTPYGTVVNASLGRVSWELNGPGAAEITVATTDPDAALLQPGREVQIYRYGDLLWWGTIVRPQGGLKTSTWQCAGLLWYFSHRFIGRADRVNELVNGDFEAGESGWTFVNGVTHSSDTGTFLEGAKSLKLTGATADHTGHATQTWTHPAGGHPFGDLMTASVWVYIPSGTYLGGAIQDRGLLLIRRNAGGDVLDVQPASVNIDDDIPKDEWVELEAAVPAVKEGDTVEVRLYPPHGVAYFDLTVLVFMESLSFGYPPPSVDVAEIIEGLVLYAQDNFPGFIHGKSDLNIDVDAAPTSVTQSRAYQFAEHRNLGDAILEFVRDGIVDIDIVITETTRTFTTYSPQKGTLYGTTLELDVNLADFTWAWDGEAGASSVVLLGPGDGPDRPEGGAVDPSFVGGAFTAEIVEVAADDVTIGQLDLRSAERLAVAARPEVFQVTTLPGAGIIGNIAVGDTVPVVISHGWIDLDATYRVAHIDADLGKDQATLTLNAVP